MSRLPLVYFGVSAPADKVNSVTVFSPLFATAANEPVGSIAIPSGRLPELLPEFAVVVAVKAPVPPIENAATVPFPELLTNKKFPAGLVTASKGTFKLVPISVAPMRVKAPVPAVIENAVTVLAALFGTYRNWPVGSIAGIAGVLKVVNWAADRTSGVNPPSEPIE